MTIYLDILWFLNLCIDYLLIALTAIVLKRKFQHIRMITAALFASCIIFFMFTSFGALFYHPITKLVYSMIIVYIAFGYKRLSYFLQGLFMFYFVTFMTGGALFALHFFGQSKPVFIEQLMLAGKGYVGSPISWLFVVIGFPLVWLFSKHRLEVIEWKKIQYDQIVNVEIKIANELIQTTGLIDSGNQLTDPFSKKPVMIIEASLLYQYFPKEAIDQLLTFHEGGVENYEENELMKRATIVPYRVIGQASPFLIAIHPDLVSIDDKNGRIETKDVLLGIEKKELSPDGVFQCIVHPKLVIHRDKKLA